jgi:hypothetical protein
MARKKYSREQYASFRSIARVCFKLELDWSDISGTQVFPSNLPFNFF